MAWSPNQVLREIPKLQVLPMEDIQVLATRILTQKTTAPYHQKSCDPLMNLRDLSQNVLKPFIKDQIRCSYPLGDDVAYGAWIVPSSTEWDTTVPITDFRATSAPSFSYLITGRTGNDVFHGVGHGC